MKDYEDELDRMRLRSQRPKHRRDDDLEIIDFDDDYEDYEGGYDYPEDDYEDDYRYERRPKSQKAVQRGRSNRVQRSRESRRRGTAPVPHSSQRGNNNRSGRVKRKKKTPLLILLAVLAAFLAFGYYYFFVHKQTGYWNIAIFGVDARDGNLGKGTRSDVAIVCSINRSTGEMKLVSVFRDTYMQIDQGDEKKESEYHKINEAYFRGGPTQAIDALNENLDLEITDYATFNWKAVAQAINILGGVELEITPEEFSYINGFITETVESTGIYSTHLAGPGYQHLDGVQAVAYARLRKMDTDYNRTARQRKVISLAMEKAKNADFAVLNNILVTVLPQVSTSIGVDDLIPMAKGVKKYHIGETTGFPFARTETYIGKKDCVIPLTLESNVIQLHEFLYGDTSYTPSAAVKKISARIASDSGMGEVGKDVETGNSYNNLNHNGSGNSSPPVQTQPVNPEPVTEESVAEPVSTEETSQETTAEDAGETSLPETSEVEKEESKEHGPGVETKPAGPETKPSSEKEETSPGPGGNDETVQTTEVIQTTEVVQTTEAVPTTKAKPDTTEEAPNVAGPGAS